MRNALYSQALLPSEAGPGLQCADACRGSDRACQCVVTRRRRLSRRAQGTQSTGRRRVGGTETACGGDRCYRLQVNRILHASRNSAGRPQIRDELQGSLSAVGARLPDTKSKGSGTLPPHIVHATILWCGTG